MSQYVVSARKYRPTRFNEMVGQEQVATTLINAIRTGHLAHSFLFCGPRGVGKTTAARILAKTINCENITTDFEACGKCASCSSFHQNASFNIHELDAASNNSVEDIRSLVDQVRFPPQSGKYKIYIIDEVHMLSASAFNAFLKTLEEPPAYCKFILATTEKHKILPTILSRCQIFDFKRIGVDTIVKHLHHIAGIEKIDVEEEALHIIAQKADGGMRDALSMFDRLASFSGGKLTYLSVLDNLNVLDYDYFFKVTDALLAENLVAALQLFDAVQKKGFEGDDFILGLCEHFRNLLFSKDAATLALLEISDSLQQRYAAQTALAPADFLLNGLNIGNQCDVHYKAAKNKRLSVELALMRMCYVNSLIAIEADSGKKKLREVTPEEQKPAEGNVTLTTAEKKPLDKTTTVTRLVEEPKLNITKEQPPVASTKTATLSKTKKLLTLDSLKEGVTSEGQSETQHNKEETYTGEIVILNQENILKLWEEYAAGIPDDKKGLRITFANYKPVLDEQVLNKITLVVQSDVQSAQFESVKFGIQHFISKRVGASVELDIVADKEVANVVKPYTPKEKFERLIQKNPAIKKMQQELGLELDYD